MWACPCPFHKGVLWEQQFSYCLSHRPILHETELNRQLQAPAAANKLDILEQHGDWAPKPIWTFQRWNNLLPCPSSRPGSNTLVGNGTILDLYVRRSVKKFPKLTRRRRMKDSARSNMVGSLECLIAVATGVDRFRRAVSLVFRFS